MKTASKILAATLLSGIVAVALTGASARADVAGARLRQVLLLEADLDGRREGTQASTADAGKGGRELHVPAVTARCSDGRHPGALLGP